MAFASYETDFSSLDEKLQNQLTFGDDVEIYDFGGDELEDSANTFNDDTFGGSEPVGRDFDFSGQTASMAGVVPALEKPAPQTVKPADKAAWSLDDDMLLAPVRPTVPKARTLAEIEAELLASARTATPPQPQAPRPKTLEEIEAELMNTRGQSPQQFATAPPGAFPMQYPMHPQQRVPSPVKMPLQHPNFAQTGFAQARQGSPMQGQPLPPMPPPPKQPSNLDFPPLGQQPQPQQQQPRQQQPFAPGPPPPVQNTSSPAPQPKEPSLGQLHGMRAAILSRYPHGQIPPDQHELLRRIENSITETERREVLLRTKANKLNEFASHNGVMTNGEKDFITRIQLSQLLNTLGPNGTHDPLKEDFYFTVYSAIRGARAAQQDKSGGQGNRRNRAMNKMAQQVQRIVDDARKKPKATQLSLEGALGKIAIRTRSAPRQLLQVTTPASSDKEGQSAPASGPVSTPADTAHAEKKPAMTHRQALLALEKVYDLVLQIEQIKRVQPQLQFIANTPGTQQEGHQAALEDSVKRYNDLVAQLWRELGVSEPVDVSNPHPFIALLAPAKGKKLLPRVLRHINASQNLTVFTLLLACFSQLDVVRDAYIIDSVAPEPNVVLAANQTRRTRKDVEADSDLFMSTVVPSFLATIGKLPLRVITGLMSLFVERNELLTVTKSRAGVAFLTCFLSTAEMIKQAAAAAPPADGAPPQFPVPDENEKVQWTNAFNTLFYKLQGHLVDIFPSTRFVANLPFGASMFIAQQAAASASLDLDTEDEPVWSFLAAVAVCADMQQQQALVAEVREKVLECVSGVSKSGTTTEKSQHKIRNVNLLLHALGLDASQITT